MALTKTAAISEPCGITPPEQPIRDAASTIVWRKGVGGVEVLMGQRNQAASFMPSKFVFPGGRVDPIDAESADDAWLAPRCSRRLLLRCAAGAAAPATLAAAALRELREETGLELRREARMPLRYIFRAITPPGATRRFDARFFLLDAADLLSDAVQSDSPDHELSQLQWIAIAQSRRFDLPFITSVVLDEVDGLLGGGRDEGVPFFNSTLRPSSLERLR